MGQKCKAPQWDLNPLGLGAAFQPQLLPQLLVGAAWTACLCLAIKPPVLNLTSDSACLIPLHWSDDLDSWLNMVTVIRPALLVRVLWDGTVSGSALPHQPHCHPWLPAQLILQSNPLLQLPDTQCVVKRLCLWQICPYCLS